ncbi:MAG: amidase [Acetobacteraceae bacterium SCN 69-10]|nr:MAG: amidase [Acetobacteraceae bacterium SCN 69-10]OJY63440.1 MAG: amidase [Rhodospirillales bacterium 70-18]
MTVTEEDLGFLPATELAPMIRQKKISPVEVMTALLSRIGKLEPKINAMAALDPELAMEGARAAERAVMGGGELGRLHGLPVTIKDLVWTKDFNTEAGSHMQKGFRAPMDAPIVSRLKQAGAVVVGKTTTSEFGWTGVSRSPLTGITSNPWKQGYNAGASSAGAGAAAAAGYGALHQGSDGAGSVRMPSHFCGIFGLKPSFGRVPYHPVPVGDFTSHIGPMTRTVADSALMLEVMGGPHPLDHTTLEAWPADYTGRLNAGIKGARVGFSADLGHARVDPEVAGLVRAAAERFAAGAGLAMQEFTPAWGRLGPELGRGFWSAHMARMAPKLAKWEAQMDPGLVACIRAGSEMSVTDYLALKERKHAYITAIHASFTDLDFVITPTVSVAAFPAERLSPEHWPQHPWDWLQWAEFSYPFNMSWNPAATVPCGFTSAGLPVGMQIVGRRFDDLGVLQAAAAFEQVQPWADKRPAMDW